MMKQYSVRTDSISVTFTGPRFGIAELVNRRTGACLLRNGTQEILVRHGDQVFDPTFLTRLVSASPSGGGWRFILGDDAGTTTARFVVRPCSDGLQCTMTVRGPRPVWMVEWRTGPLDLREIILPALGGQALSSAMPVDTTLTFKYPFWWNAQFAIGMADRGGLWLSARDPEPEFKLLRVRRDEKGFGLTYGFEAHGPLRRNPVSATWYIDCFDGDWRVPVEEYRKWLESVRPLVAFNGNRRVPDWARDVNCILEIWGIGKERPDPLHTFDEMEGVLRRWAGIHPPRNTLVYLPGFAEHGIDSNAPSYRPSAALGGTAKLRALTKSAHAMGYRVMLHTNVLAMTYTHPAYRTMRRHTVVDVFGRPQGWGLDMDGDWLPEPYFAYMHPGARAWGDLMKKVLGSLIRDVAPDGIFLDQTLLAFNVSRGSNFVKGMRLHIERLRRAFPEVLFAGEGINDMIAQALPMAQIHGIDSIAEVHALDGQVPWRTVHPVSTELFGRYTRFMAHLLTRHPSHRMFPAQEAAYAALNVIPAFCLYHNGQTLDHPALGAMLRRASGLTNDNVPHDRLSNP